MGFSILKTIWDKTPDLDVTATELSVLTALAMFMNDATHDCHPSIPRIAVQTKLGKSTVKDKLRSLQAKGLITETRRYNRSNLYDFPFLTATPAKYATPKQRQPPLTQEEQYDAADLSAAFVKLCNNPGNRKRDWNTFNKLIRERNIEQCLDVFYQIQSETAQGEHDNARNIGAIISNKLKSIPLKVINNQPKQSVQWDDTQPSLGLAADGYETIGNHLIGRQPTLEIRKEHKN